MSQCKLWLENYNGQYFPGTVIQGKLVITLDSDTNLRAVKIRIVCHEHTEWMASERYYDDSTKEHRSRDTLFKGDNDVFTNEVVLYGGASGTTTLPMGQHIYPFSYTLPPNVPSTYQTENGNISYKIYGIVDRPMAFDHEDQFIFVVNSPIDLNSLQRQDLLQPSSYSDEKTVCCWCCAQGPISLDVELPKKTLVPGETINVQVRISNLSSTNIEGISLELTQRINMQVRDPDRDHKLIKNVLTSVNEVGVGAHGEHTFNLNVYLPTNIFIPNFSMCSLFSAEYEYKVVAKLPSPHSNLEVKTAPVLGHIPIGSPPPAAGPGGWVAAPTAPPGEPGYNPKAYEATQPNQGGGYGASGPAPPSYDSLNLP